MFVESPASAGLSRVLVALALLLGGCAVGGGGGDETAEQGGALPEEFAEPARPLAAAGAPGTTTAGAVTATTAGRGGTTTTPSPRGTPGGGAAGAVTTTTTAAPGAAPYTTRADVVDRTGDAGLQAKPHGDLVSLRLDDDGTRARVAVRLAGTLPDPPAAGEVIGIGVDLYRGNQRDSEYQLFAIGNADGWRAGLQEGTEWVDYPGTFELGGDTLVFTVPWSALGGRRPGSLSVFADWSQGRVAVVADASEDHAPDRGAQSFSF